MKHLVMLTDNFLPRHDGIVRFLVEVLPFLAKQFKVTLICPQYKEATVDVPGVHIEYIPVSSRFAGDFPVPKCKPMRLFRLIRKADIVFGQTLGPIGATGLFIAQWLKKPTVSFIHSLEWELVTKATELRGFRATLGRFTKRIVRYLYSRNTLLIVPSERISDRLNWERINTSKKVIHLAVDSERFQPFKEAFMRTEERERLGFSDKDIVIGYHGRLAKEKDIPTLIRAFIKLRNKNFPVKLLIVGSGTHRIEKLVGKQPATTHIKAIPNVEHYLRVMDIYVLPSLTETTSLSTLEAMSTGLACVATPVGFIRDYIKTGKNGLLFNKGDSYDLYLKLEYLIKHPHKRFEMGKDARTYVVKNFSWSTTAERLTKVLSKL